MKNKKMVSIGVAAAMFTAATIFNMGKLSKSSGGDVSLKAIATMAQANPEEADGYSRVVAIDTGETTHVECSGKGRLECKA